MARLLDGASSFRVGGAVAPDWPLTIAGWFAPSVTGVDNFSGVGVFNETTGQGWSYLSYMGDTFAPGLFGARSYDGGGSYSAYVDDVRPSAGQWMHGCAVFTSASQRRAFSNGVGGSNEVSTVSPSGANSTHVGAIYFGAGIQQPFKGRIAEVGMWTTALSEREIRALARGVSPTLIRPSSLVAYWPLFGVTAPEPDRWRNGNALQLVGAPVKADHVRMFYPSVVTGLAQITLGAQFAAASVFSLRTTIAALRAPVVMAAASSFAITTTAVISAPQPLRATTSFALQTTSASLRAPVMLKAQSSIAFSTTASFASKVTATQAIWGQNANKTVGLLISPE